MAEKIVKPMSIKAIEKILPNIEVKKGKWRLELLKAGEELEKHGMEWEPPKNTPILMKAAVFFWQQLFASGDLGFFKELGDRMDGKAPQALHVADNEGGKIAVSMIQLVPMKVAE